MHLADIAGKWDHWLVIPNEIQNVLPSVAERRELNIITRWITARISIINMIGLIIWEVHGVEVKSDLYIP